jgi:hypothetical protein
MPASAAGFDELTKALALGVSRRSFLSRVTRGLFALAGISLPATILAEPVPQPEGTSYDKATSGLKPFWVYYPAIVEGMCVNVARWFRPDAPDREHYKAWTKHACPVAKDGTCGSVDDCYNTSKRLGGATWTFRTSPHRNEGVDKYHRLVTTTPQYFKNDAALFFTKTLQGNWFNFCVWEFQVLKYENGYDPKLDPKLHVVSCKPDGIVDMLGEDGKPKIDPKTNKAIQIPKCPALLDCIEKELPAKRGKLSPNLPKPLIE